MTRYNNLRRLLIGIMLCFSLMVIPAQAQDIQADILRRVNDLRVSLGLPVYQLNGALNAAAFNQASWMAIAKEVSHVQPDGSRPRDRALAAGYGSAWVSENIYIGTSATANDAWRFWMNSPIHYAGLVSPNYSDVGIASAADGGWRSFVMVFGNPGGTASTVISGGNDNRVASNTGNGGNTNRAPAAPAAPPSFVVGLDAVGNIQHQIQPGDTLGDIALIYGYTWDDIPRMLSLNNLTQDDMRLLEVGSIFLVPPHAGTFTPTPPPTHTPTPEAPPPDVAVDGVNQNVPNQDVPVSDASQDTSDVSSDGLIQENNANNPMPSPTLTLPPPQQAVVVAPATSTPQSLPTMTQAQDTSHANTGLIMPAATFVMPSPTRPLIIRTLPVSTQVAMQTTPVVAQLIEVAPPSNTSDSGPPLWLVVAVGLQIGMLSFASVEFVRRSRRN